MRVLGVRPRPEPPVTEEEISVLLQEGTKAGVFEEGEHEMIKRVFRFSDRRARALMTPRNEVVWIDLADPPEEIRRKVIASPHTRFPVCDQSLDNLLGIVQVKDLLVQDQNVEPFRIKGRLTLPLFIYEGTRGLKILEMFKKSAIARRRRPRRIRNGRGLADAHRHPGSHRGRHARRRRGRRAAGGPALGWVLAPGRPDAPGRVSRPLRAADRSPKAISTPWPDWWSRSSVTSLESAESFDRWGLHFEVVDMDGNRVDRILVKPAMARRSEPAASRASSSGESTLPALKLAGQPSAVLVACARRTATLRGSIPVP